jgi:hypothetical protein
MNITYLSMSRIAMGALSAEMREQDGRDGPVLKNGLEFENVPYSCQNLRVLKKARFSARAFIATVSGSAH